MRFIALDVHRDFREVAIKDESGLRLAGQVKASVAELELFAQKPGARRSLPSSVTSSASHRRRSSSHTWGLIRRCASQARRRRDTGASQSRARPRRATCSARPPGC
jgi:hypothetical protein